MHNRKYVAHFGTIVDLIVGKKVSRSDARLALRLIDSNLKMRKEVMMAFKPGIATIKESLKAIAEKPRTRTRTKK